MLIIKLINLYIERSRKGIFNDFLPRLKGEIIENQDPFRAGGKTEF